MNSFPPMVRPLGVMVQQIINRKISELPNGSLEMFDSDINNLLDAIARKDFETASVLLDRYNASKNDDILYIVARSIRRHDQSVDDALAEIKYFSEANDDGRYELGCV